LDGGLNAALWLIREKFFMLPSRATPASCIPHLRAAGKKIKMADGSVKLHPRLLTSPQRDRQPESTHWPVFKHLKSGPTFNNATWSAIAAFWMYYYERALAIVGQYQRRKALSKWWMESTEQQFCVKFMG